MSARRTSPPSSTADGIFNISGDVGTIIFIGNTAATDTMGTHGRKAHLRTQMCKW